MTMLDGENGPRSVLPPIHHVVPGVNESDTFERSRPHIMPPLDIPTEPRSPVAPNMGISTSYSVGSATHAGAHERSGYISPPESTTRRSTREEKESPFTVKSLPSIHEALGSRSILNPVNVSSNDPRSSGSTPATGSGISYQELPGGPSGPSPHPFSQPVYSPPSTSTSHSLTEPNLKSPRNQEISTVAPQSTPTDSHDTRPASHKTFPFSVSPRTTFSTPRYESTPASAGLPRQPMLPVTPSTYQPPAVTHTGSAPAHNPRSAPLLASLTSAAPREAVKKPEDARHSNSGPVFTVPYGDTVKRRLDVYDAEVALHEVGEVSSRTTEFARYWSQRLHEANRSHTLPEGVPQLQEIDETIRQSQRVVENLHRLREVASTQQTTLSEEHARLVHHPSNEPYRNTMDDCKGGGYAAGDAKKRRGKAAPPGRCHSCNRAETPEWRRGPDGARTLCNACGLHYAKLTRKLSANKSAHIAASSLRPKGLDGTH